MARHFLAMFAACGVALGILQLAQVDGPVAETVVGILAVGPGTLAVMLWARVFTEPARLLSQGFGKLVLAVVLLGLNLLAVSALAKSGAPWATATYTVLAVAAGIGFVFVFWLRAELRARSRAAWSA